MSLAPYALALLRIVAGLLFLEHGLIKLIGFPPGIPPGPIPFDAVLNWSMPQAEMWIAAVIETITGAMLILGLLTRFAAFIASGEMAVAYWQIHFHYPEAIYPAGNGGDAAILFCLVFFYFIFAGPGALSIDSTGKK
jgi:putative oxidoreductase